MFMQATAGLRQLEGDASDKILQAVITCSKILIAIVLFLPFSEFILVTPLNFCIGEGLFE